MSNVARGPWLVTRASSDESSVIFEFPAGEKISVKKRLQDDYYKTACGCFSTGHGSRDTGHVAVRPQVENQINPKLRQDSRTKK
jgi:hypothetical protein